MPPTTAPSPPDKPGVRTGHQPRVIVYHQAHHFDHRYVPILPLVEQHTGLTHFIVAAIHLNYPPGNIHLNDNPPTDPRYNRLRADLATLQREHGIKVLGLLGGAAAGSFRRLDGDEPAFRAYYEPLLEAVRFLQLDGLDLDVEEEMSLAGIVRLILALKRDLGDAFLITLAPVCRAMWEAPYVPRVEQQEEHLFDGALERRRRADREAEWRRTHPNGEPYRPPLEERIRPRPANLSGFSYAALERAVGDRIAWYNVQFYCGWGSLAGVQHVRHAVTYGRWDLRKLVLGTVTNPGNGAGFVSDRALRRTFAALRREYGKGALGGVMGWEYFNSKIGRGKWGRWEDENGWGEATERPWEWVMRMGELVRGEASEFASWDEEVCVWDGRFGETKLGDGAGAQDDKGRWR